MKIFIKKKSKPIYGFNISKEFEQYEKICKYSNDKIKYSDWEEKVVKNICSFKDINLKNFKHYIINEKREAKNLLETLGSIVVPTNILLISVYVTCISVFLNLRADMNKDYDSLFLNGFNCFICFIIAISFALAIYSFIILHFKRKKLFNKISFFNDLIYIIDNHD